MTQFNKVLIVPNFGVLRLKLHNTLQTGGAHGGGSRTCSFEVKFIPAKRAAQPSDGPHTQKTCCAFTPAKRATGCKSKAAGAPYSLKVHAHRLPKRAAHCHRGARCTRGLKTMNLAALWRPIPGTLAQASKCCPLLSWRSRYTSPHSLRNTC